MLGFLIASTCRHPRAVGRPVFQSRAGFSDRLDSGLMIPTNLPQERFNPVLGFLIASTDRRVAGDLATARFQSRAGFSDRLDLLYRVDLLGELVSIPCWVF